MHHNLSSGIGKYDILLEQTGIYEEAGFKDGDYTILYAVDNYGKAHPFLAQLKTNTVSGVLVPNFEDPAGYYEHTATLTKAQVASMLIGLSPYDMAKDILDFAASKDIFTGEEINRWLLAVFIITPEIIDQGIKAYGKNADAIAVVVKNGGKIEWKISDLKFIDNFKQGSKENALKHIFEGDIFNGKASGFHYEGVASCRGRIIGNVDTPNAYGVYRANVEVDGIVKGAKSTFFQTI